MRLLGGVDLQLFNELHDNCQKLLLEIDGLRNQIILDKLTFEQFQTNSDKKLKNVVALLYETTQS